MRSLVFAAVIAATAALNWSPASAAQYGTTAGVPHWAWQYHYVGRHHPHYELGWVLVK